MDASSVTAWVKDYMRAWETNDREDIRRLFTEDALYYTAPYRQPWRGREGIVEGWLDRKDEPGTWTFQSEVLGLDGDVAFVQGVTEYSDEEQPKTYSNLWVIRFDPEGRCSEFTEWWMENE